MSDLRSPGVRILSLHEGPGCSDRRIRLPSVDRDWSQTLPFPDGTVIAALHYRHVLSEENNKVFGREQSFVAGDPTNVQFMVKDSKTYAATGGWGFFHFLNDGKPLTDKKTIQDCFDCHALNQGRDLVFTRYAP